MLRWSTRLLSTPKGPNMRHRSARRERPRVASRAAHNRSEWSHRCSRTKTRRKALRQLLLQNRCKGERAVLTNAS